MFSVNQIGICFAIPMPQIGAIIPRSSPWLKQLPSTAAETLWFRNSVSATQLSCQVPTGSWRRAAGAQTRQRRGPAVLAVFVRRQDQPRTHRRVRPGGTAEKVAADRSGLWHRCRTGEVQGSSRGACGPRRHGGLQEVKAEKRKAFLDQKAEETEKSIRTL
jgi:hypothetical protein